MVNVRWIADPGHAWLRVKIEDLPQNFKSSDCSFIDHAYVYLEEDVDAINYIEYCARNNIQRNYEEQDEIPSFERKCWAEDIGRIHPEWSPPSVFVEGSDLDTMVKERPYAYKDRDN